jgi:hypothetical protein
VATEFSRNSVSSVSKELKVRGGLGVEEFRNNEGISVWRGGGEGGEQRDERREEGGGRREEGEAYVAETWPL